MIDTSIVDRLKEIDSMINIGKSEVQLKVLLNLEHEKPTSLAILQSHLRVPKRSLVDAVQKLKNKGLVEITEKGVYRLTLKGKKLKESILGLGGYSLYQACIAIRLLLTLAVVGTKELKIRRGKTVFKETVPIWVTLEELSKAIDMDANEVAYILDAYCYDYVKKREIEEGLLEYKLNDRGLSVARKILKDLGLSFFSAKVIGMIAVTADPLTAMRRFMLLYAILTFITIMTAPLYPWHIIPSVIWLVITLYTAFLLGLTIKD